MSDVARLTAELELAKLSEKLEAARDRMHGDRSAANIKSYKAASEKVAKARQAFREKHRTAPDGPGDAAAAPATVSATTEAKL